jgi:hypothetical protein
MYNRDRKLIFEIHAKIHFSNSHSNYSGLERPGLSKLVSPESECLSEIFSCPSKNYQKSALGSEEKPTASYGVKFSREKGLPKKFIS